MNSLFTLLSLIYQAGCQLKNLLYRIHILKPKRAALPVISIGNITFGGSEKTPLAMEIIATLLHHGHKPALVTRGYKGNWEKKGGILSDGVDILGEWTDSGDEAYMVAWNFPRAGVFIGKNRERSCREAARLGFDVAILDDGFQHRKLVRDLDIVLHNPEKKTPLREPVASLKRAHVLLVKADNSKKVNTKNMRSYLDMNPYIYDVQSQGFFRLDERIQSETDELKTKRVLAFCGIARPERFLTLLASIGIKPCSFLKFPDHHAYPLPTQQKILNSFQAHNAEVLLTTEKDAVKIRNVSLFQGRPVFYLKIGLKIQGAFEAQILSLLEKTKSGRRKGALQS